MKYQVRTPAELAARLANEEGSKVVRGTKPQTSYCRFTSTGLPYATRLFTISGTPDVMNWRRFGLSPIIMS